MLAIKVKPEVHYFDTTAAFNEVFNINEDDVLVTNEWMYDPYIKPLNLKCNVIFQEKYGMSEPSDEMIDGIYEEMKKYNPKRVIALGGGTIIDICKTLALDIPGKSYELFPPASTVEPKKVRELICIPSTCGTGSEVSKSIVVEIKSKNIKTAIAVEDTYADYAVLIPEVLKGLPYKVFSMSSVDALIHCIEAFLAPKASPGTDLFAMEGIKLIMDGYKLLTDKGLDARFDYYKEFLYGSCYGGLAFSVTGVAAIHALSYSIGAAFHVPHGESNYVFFTEVMKLYNSKKPDGKIKTLSDILADSMGISRDADVFEELDKFLSNLIEKKPLKEYGTTEAQIDEFTTSTRVNQQRILVNNYVEFTDEEIRSIFVNLY